MNSTMYPTPSPEPERRPVKIPTPRRSINKGQLFGSSASPIFPNVFSNSVNSGPFKNPTSSQPTTGLFRDTTGNSSSQSPTSQLANKSPQPGNGFNPSSRPPPTIFSNNVSSGPFKKPPSSQSLTSLSGSNTGISSSQSPARPFANKSLQPGNVFNPSLNPPTIFSNNVSSGPFKKPPSSQSVTGLFGDNTSNQIPQSPTSPFVNKGSRPGNSPNPSPIFQPKILFKHPPSSQPTAGLFGDSEGSPSSQLLARPLANKSPQPGNVSDPCSSPQITIFSNNVSSGPFKKPSSSQPAIYPFRVNSGSPIPLSARSPLVKKSSEAGKAFSPSPSIQSGSPLTPNQLSSQPVVDRAAGTPSPTGGTTAGFIFDCFASPSISTIRPSSRCKVSNPKGDTEKKEDQQRTIFLNIAPPTTFQLPDEESQDNLVAEFQIILDELTVDRAFARLAKLSESISSLRLSIIKRQVEIRFNCLMDWKWTVPISNSDPPVTIKGSAVDNSPLPTESPAANSSPSSINVPAVDNGPQPLEATSVNNDSPPSKSRFLPRFSDTPKGSQTDIAKRFQGWIRHSRNGRNLLLQYGSEENPLIEIVPGGVLGKVIGNMSLSKLTNIETLKEKWEKWEKLGLNSWDDDMRITNVAKSGSARFWVCINNSIWVTKTNLEKFRIEDGMRPLGHRSAVNCILQCVKEKVDWYRAAGYPDEADQYLNQFLGLSQAN